MVLQIIAIIIIMLWIASTCPLLGCLSEYGFAAFEEIFNPVVKYKRDNLNIFGVIILTAILNIIFMPMAIVFWFYKLCTIKRR